MCQSYHPNTIALVVLFLLCAAAPPAEAALRARETQIPVAQAVNPKPDPADSILPMPCGASMAFRIVGVQSNGFLSDMSTSFGSDSSERPDREYYERRYNTAISAPFSEKDLPAAWRKNLPKAPAGHYYYYLIGKYEVSNVQWQAIMEGVCPHDMTKLPPEAARPKTDISWIDAIAFNAAYTEWLLKNHPDLLPSFEGDGKNIGYLRLPTEKEWEYAARGGHSVPRADIREREAFVLQEGADYTEYGVFRGNNQAPESLQAIGSRRPNPLGVFDTMGNASEMVMDTFHFSLGGRLHGSSGGFVVKGGSFRSPLQDVLPGKREELAVFIKDGANRLNDMGMRVVLSGINTPAGSRPDILRREWENAGRGDESVINKDKNLMEEMDRLIANATTQREKTNLTFLRGILKDNNIELERQKTLSAESLIRSSAFMVSTIHNIAIRHKSIVNLRNQTQAELKNALANWEKAKKSREKLERTVGQESIEEIRKEISMLEQNLASLKQSLYAAIAFYRSKITDSREYSEKLFTDTEKILAAEIKGDDLFAVTARNALALYTKHVTMLRAGKSSQLTPEFLIKDIVPEHLRVEL